VQPPTRCYQGTPTFISRHDANRYASSGAMVLDLDRITVGCSGQQTAPQSDRIVSTRG
jgi:hypothetical protein